MTCSLYRHFDKDNRLLYVGVSLSALNRLAQHADASHWFADIATVKIETFEDRSVALAAEREAILKENPLHNLKRPTIREIKASHSEESRIDLVRRIVQFNPTYTPSDVASLLNIGLAAMKRLIDGGKIGFIKIGEKTRITGWQVIEYLEASQPSSHAHVPAHVPGVDSSGKSRKMAEETNGSSPL